MYMCGSEDVIPIKFRKYSGVRDYQFRLSSQRCEQDLESNGGWYCNIDTGAWKKVFLPLSHFPNQIEALAILSKLDGETERQGRYINVHMAYESVVINRNVDYSAIRHALAHPVTKLTRPNVCSSLTKRFGGLNIDLKNYNHQKELYRCIGQMLIEIEKSLYEEIIQKMSLTNVYAI